MTASANERSVYTRFPLGQTVGTPGALRILEATGTSPSTLLGRHQRGDWGDVPPGDAQENEFSVLNGFRILSSYRVGDEKLWVITEADRSVTTILRPDEDDMDDPTVGTKALTFTVHIVVHPTAITSTLTTHDKRSVEAVVADEITSNLESVPYVESVTVRRITK